MPGTTWDIAIVGGGLAGSTLASLLSDQGFQVGLVEASTFNKPRMGEVVPYSLLKWWQDNCQFDLFEHKPALGSKVAFHVLWGDSAPSVYRTRSLAQPTHLRVDRLALDRCMFEHARSRGVEALLNTHLGRAERDSSGWKLELSQAGKPRCVRVRFAIEACGRSRYSCLTVDRARLYEDAQIACVLRLPPTANERVHQRVWIESHEFGWWYASALPDRECLLVFLTDHDLLPKCSNLRKCWLAQQWSQTQASRSLFDGQIVDRECEGNWYYCDARMSLRHQCFGNGWMVVGDSQMALDPLSGQGITEAMNSAWNAARFLGSDRSFQGLDWKAWADSIADRYNLVRQQRWSQYQAEQRFNDALYWQRRHRRVFKLAMA